MPDIDIGAPPEAVLGVFQALADENRLRIVDVLMDGERCVCEIQASLDMGQSLLSHHLRVLREVGLVRARREGRWVHYALSDTVWADAEAWVSTARVAAQRSHPRLDHY